MLALALLDARPGGLVNESVAANVLPFLTILAILILLVSTIDCAAGYNGI